MRHALRKKERAIKRLGLRGSQRHRESEQWAAIRRRATTAAQPCVPTHTCLLLSIREGAAQQMFCHWRHKGHWVREKNKEQGKPPYLSCACGSTEENSMGLVVSDYLELLCLFKCRLTHHIAFLLKHVEAVTEGIASSVIKGYAARCHKTNQNEAKGKHSILH